MEKTGRISEIKQSWKSQKMCTRSWGFVSSHRIVFFIFYQGSIQRERASATSPGAGLEKF